MPSVLSKSKKTMIKLDPPSGTRDFLPVDMRAENWIFKKWKTASEKFGFEQYDAPVLENVALYERKQGEEITQQMYNFVDKEGTRVTLRPEMTPSLQRMVLKLTRASEAKETRTDGDSTKTSEDKPDVKGNSGIAQILPLKWYSLPQCWRFETTQRGRKREHYQWNVDMIGCQEVTQEVELMSVIVYFFRSIGLTQKDVVIKVNSRKVLGQVCSQAGVPDEKFAPTVVVVDKLDKIGRDECVFQLTCTNSEEMKDAQGNALPIIGLEKNVAERIVDATKAKTVEEFAQIAGITLEDPAVKELRDFFELASSGYGIGDWLKFDQSVVRGLSYYTGIVFEGADRKGAERAICGGGRYDELLTTYGAPKSLPMCGFGFGDCVIMEILKDKKLLPTFESGVDIVVVPFTEDLIAPAMQAAAELRKNDQNGRVLLVQEPMSKMSKAFSYANRCGAKYVCFFLEEKWGLAEKLVTVKNLAMGKDVPLEEKQRNIPLNELSGDISSRFSTQVDGLSFDGQLIDGLSFDGLSLVRKSTVCGYN